MVAGTGAASMTAKSRPWDWTTAARPRVIRKDFMMAVLLEAELSLGSKEDVEEMRNARCLLLLMGNNEFLVEASRGSYRDVE